MFIGLAAACDEKEAANSIISMNNQMASFAAARTVSATK